MSADWLRALRDCRRRGDAAVMVVMASVRGSAPREPGARLLVARHPGTGIVTTHGTIGGGHLELQAIGIARDMLEAGAARSTRRFALGASLGQCCGGAVELLFDPVGADEAWPSLVIERLDAGQPRVVVTRVHGAAGQPIGDRLVVTAHEAHGELGNATLAAAAIEVARQRLRDPHAPAALLAAMPADAETVLFFDVQRPADFNVVLFGAGHVGRALVPVLAPVAASLTWVDERASEFPLSVPPNVRCVVSDEPDEAIAAAPARAWFVVMTHSHALDQAIVEEILARDDFAWCGLIGSRTKRRLFEQRLQARGVAPERLALVTCPIGIEGIAGKSPATVALAVAAQMVREYERHAAVLAGGTGHAAAQEPPRLSA